MATDHRGNELQSAGGARPHLELRVALSRIRQAPEEPATPRTVTSAISNQVPRRGPKMGDFSQADDGAYAQTSPPAITRRGQTSREPRVSTGGAPPPIAFPTRNTPAAYDVLNQSRQQRNDAAESLGRNQIKPAREVFNRTGNTSPVLRELAPLVQNHPNAEQTKKVARRFGAPLLLEKRAVATRALMTESNSAVKIVSRQDNVIKESESTRWSEETIRDHNEEQARIRQRNALASRIEEEKPITYGTEKRPLTKSRKGKSLENKVSKALGIGKDNKVPRINRSLKPFPIENAKEDIPAGTILEKPIKETPEPTSYQRITASIVTKDKFGNRVPVVSARRVNLRDADETASPKKDMPMYDSKTGEKLQKDAVDYERQYGYIKVPRTVNLPGPNVDIGRETNLSKRPTIVTKGSRDVRGTYRQGDAAAIRAGMTEAGGMASKVRSSKLADADIPGIDILGKKGIYRSPQLAAIATQALLDMNPDQRKLRGAALEQRVLQRRGDAATPELRQSVERGQQAAAKVIANPSLRVQRSGARAQTVRRLVFKQQARQYEAGQAEGDYSVKRSVGNAGGKRKFVNPEASKAVRERLTKAQEMQEYRTLRERGRQLAIEKETPEEVANIRTSLGLSKQLPKGVSVVGPREEVAPPKNKKEVKKPRVIQTAADLADPSYIVKSRQKRLTARKLSRGESPSEDETARAAGTQTSVHPEREDKPEEVKHPKSKEAKRTQARGTAKEETKKATPRVMSSLERRAYLAQKKEGKKK